MGTAFRFTVGLLLSTLLPIANAPARADMSGTFVGGGATVAYMMQVVETSDGKFTGRYEEFNLKPNGQIEDINASISGSRSGETVVATIKPALLPLPWPVSGTLSGRTLHLTGGSNVVLDLSRGDEAAFRAQVVALTAQGQQIVTARSRQEAAQKQAALESSRLGMLQSLNTRLVAFTASVNTMLPKMEPAAQRYRAVTERMRNGLAQQTAIRGTSWQASKARTDISIALNQIAIQANQMYIADEQVEQDFDFKQRSLNQEVTNAAPWCRPGETPASLSEACAKFHEAVTPYYQRGSTLRIALMELAKTRAAERREQDAIVQASQQNQ